MFQSMIRNFAKPYGFEIDKGGYPFVQAFYLDLKGLMLLDLRNPDVLAMAFEFFACQKEQAVFNLPEEKIVNFHALIDEYIIKVWFNENSAHYLPKWSNWWEQLLTGHNVITNNGNETLNSSLKVLLRNGHVDYKSLVQSLHTWTKRRNNSLRLFYKKIIL